MEEVIKITESELLELCLKHVDKALAERESTVKGNHNG